MTTMNDTSRVDAVALIFKLNNRLVTRALEGLSDDEVWTRPAGGNAIGWILGHITEARASLLAELGDAAGTPWPKQFSRGSTPGTGPGNAPPREVMESTWRDTSGRMREAFARLDADRLGQPPSPARQSLPGVTDLTSLISFYAFHESYHVGQLGYARRLLGRESIAG